MLKSLLVVSVRDSAGLVHLYPRDKVVVCPPAIAEGAYELNPTLDLEPTATRTVIRGRVMPTPTND